MILGIDYGRKKVGLAISEGKLASPLKVVRYENEETLRSEIVKVITENKVDKIVVGVSEGEMGEESKAFAESMGAETFDETLSTFDAQELSRSAGIGREKRKEMEDAYAASVMLQNYIDTNPQQA